jgi:hypothetical protein
MALEPAWIETALRVTGHFGSDAPVETDAERLNHCRVDRWPGAWDRLDFARGSRTAGRQVTDPIARLAVADRGAPCMPLTAGCDRPD